MNVPLDCDCFFALKTKGFGSKDKTMVRLHSLFLCFSLTSPCFWLTFSCF